VEAILSARRVILLGALLALLVLGWIAWREHSPAQQPKESPAPVVVKQPVNFATRTFDPANPPADMPPLPPGENAECDSNFTSLAVVGGTSRRTDGTHATVTVTKIRVTLGLIVILWLPEGATQHVQEHEEGHRRISEAYYQTADQIAARVAANYMGKQIAISGANLDAELSKSLQQVGAEISDEYDKELNPNPAQLLYDSITDHSRNDVAAQDAVAHALKNVSVESSPPDHQ
jgi:hypothetical protein